MARSQMRDGSLIARVALLAAIAAAAATVVRGADLTLIELAAVALAGAAVALVAFKLL